MDVKVVQGKAVPCDKTTVALFNKGSKVTQQHLEDIICPVHVPTSSQPWSLRS